MSLLSICQQVANSIPVAAPGFIVGNTDTTATLLLASAQDAGDSLANRPQGGWVSMIREYTFTTAAVAKQSGTIANSGPGGTAVISVANTDGMVPSTWYAFGTGVPDNSIVTAVVTNVSVTINQAATQLGAGQFTFGKSDYALPSDFDRLIDNTVWDRSRFWSMRGPLSPQQWQVYKSSVIGRASIQRRYRFRNIANNNSFSIDPTPTDNGSSLVWEYVSNAWCRSSGGTAQTSWLADSDVGILDEYLLRLGVKWRLLRRLGMSYSDELDEYQREVSKAVAVDGGSAVLDLASADHLTLLGPWNLPEANFGP